jgi:zinc transport system substrate-binding protein
MGGRRKSRSLFTFEYKENNESRIYLKPGFRLFGKVRFEMKKKISFSLAIVFICVAAFAAIRITVTIQPYFLILEELKTTNIELRRLIDASQNPHTFSPTVQQGKLLYDSDILIYNGLHLESFLDSTMASLKNSGKTVIAVGDYLPLDSLLDGHHHDDAELTHESLTEETQGEEREEEHDSNDHESHANINPHIWLDPVFLCDAIIPGLRDLLISVDLENKEFYTEKSQKMIDAIKTLHLETGAYLSAYAGKTVLMSHPSFAYYFERYGLELDAIFEGEGDEPTASEMKALIDDLKAKKVIALFMEPQQPRKYVEILGKEAKIGIGTLDPLGWNGATIYELFKTNLSEIKRVFP